MNRRRGHPRRGTVGPPSIITNEIDRFIVAHRRVRNSGDAVDMIEAAGFAFLEAANADEAILLLEAPHAITVVLPL
jgi:hypothetical protein